MPKMTPFNGYKSEKKVSTNALPEGAYIACILASELTENDFGQTLVVHFDIIEGDKKGFFQKQFAESTRQDKKWKGVHRIKVPDESQQYFETRLKNFNGTMFAIEDSNEGYKWDWDTDSLKGKKVGVLFRQKEWEMKGDDGVVRTGWTTECADFIPVADVLSGNFHIPSPRPLTKKKYEIEEKTEDFEQVKQEDDLPF